MVGRGTAGQGLIRPYRYEDRDAVYDVAIRTGRNGGDVRGTIADPELIPTVFAGPYLLLEPDLAFVVDDGQRAVGYVIGAADTADFARRNREEWLPLVRERHPAPAGPSTSREERLAALLHNPELMIRPETTDHPAHLHINLLPEFQRRGFGRALLNRFFEALVAKGVGSVHLGVARANPSAIAFYERLGFREIPAEDSDLVLWLGRITDPI